MSDYELDLLTCDLDGLGTLTPTYSLDQLAVAGLRLLEAERGSSGRLPEATESGAELDELIAVVARRAARVADLRSQRAAARRKAAASSPVRRRATEENTRLDVRMTVLEEERDRLLAEVAAAERRLHVAGVDMSVLGPPLGCPPGVVAQIPDRPSALDVFGRWHREDHQRLGVRKRLLRLLPRRTASE